MSDLQTFDSAPLPSEEELKARTNLFVQTGRFIALNFKMLGMVRKGPH
jgi:hypothetical protein